MTKYREGISVVAFYSPEICKGIKGDAPDFFNHNDNTYTNCIATTETLAARLLTHPKVVKKI